MPCHRAVSLKTFQEATKGDLLFPEHSFEIVVSDTDRDIAALRGVQMADLDYYNYASEFQKKNALTKRGVYRIVSFFIPDGRETSSGQCCSPQGCF